MQVVIPMAGAGRRFAAAGYRLPKPLVPVAGLPLAVRAARMLPAGRRTLFVVRADHATEHAAESTLRKYLPRCEIVLSHLPTEGPACSARLACNHLDADRPVLLAGCDRICVYDLDRFEETKTDSECVVWTYRQDPRVLVCPEEHAWADASPAGRVRGISVGVPLSDWEYLDHACAGVIWFRTAKLMRDALDRLVATGKRHRGEFCAEAAAGLLARAGANVRAFEVRKHVAFASPEDLDEFRRWESCLSALAAA